jgi:hypothetical protein
MSRLITALAAAVALLLLPSIATAREPASATVCGAEGCTTVDRPPVALAGGGDGVEDAVPPPGPF